MARKMHASMIARFADERAASLVEYAIMVGLIALVAATLLMTLGDTLSSDLTDFVEQFERAKG